MNIKKLLIALLAIICSSAVKAQDKIVYPDISYAGSPRTLTIGAINVTGAEGYEDYMLTGISGLTVGEDITLPGNEITNAVKNYWKYGLFSDVSIVADSVIGNKVFLNIHLRMRPRVSTINYVGLKKSERTDMEEKLGLLKGAQITPNMIDRAKILAKKYFDDKGFKNADIQIRERDDVANKNQVILDVIIDKKQKMKVRKIYIEGNKALKNSKIKGGLFKKGVFAKTHEAGTLASFLKAKKFTPERWKADKQKLIEKYNEYGYRDAAIISDSVWNVDDKHVSIRLKVDEGKKYYIRNITWVGNTIYPSDYLNQVLGMKKGDVYNQKLMNKRLTEDDDAVGNNYWNNGYLFYSLQPTEINIVGDSIDLEMRITEGTQAHINHVRINGNDRLYENVVRRELRTKPGDLGTMDANGNVFIKGRSKNMLLSANGQNIYPEEIEDKLNSMALVNESIVIQQGDKLVGLVHPDYDEAKGMRLTNDDIVAVMEQNRQELNAEMPAYSKLSTIKIQEEEFEKTPKKSIKRYLYQNV